jgi:hypothetical protein
MVKRLMLIAVLVALPAACTGPPVIVVKNPATGEMYQCQTAGYYSYLFAMQTATECAAKHESEGWQPWPH